MTSHLGYTFIPVTKSHDQSLQAAAFQALQEGEKGEKGDKVGPEEPVEGSKIEEGISQQSDEGESDEVAGDNELPTKSRSINQEKNQSQHAENLTNLTKGELINLVIELQYEKRNLSSSLNDSNLKKQKSAALQEEVNQLNVRCKNLRKELNVQKRKLKCEANLKIDENVISLLALQLDNFELPPLFYGGSYSSNSNELKEISAALLEEVDRVHNNRIRQSQLEIYHQKTITSVKLDKDNDVDISKMREEWGEERERRLFNLEGIAEVLFNRLELIEERTSEQGGKLTGRDEGLKSVISEFDFDSTCEDVEEGSSEMSDEGIDEARKYDMKDRLDNLEKSFESLNDKFERLE